MEPIVVGVFLVVYAGMMLGELPGFKLDRTGIALLGAITLVAAGQLSLDTAWSAIDVPTLALLFALMVISAQFRLGGFYTAVTRRLGRGDHTPGALLALVILVAGGLSAVLANDIVCLAMAPVLVEVCSRRNLDPVPFLLGLASASNVGSAATLIGNPQNMLIGQTRQLSFRAYLLDGGVPAALGLAVVWAVIAVIYRRRWTREAEDVVAPSPPFDRWHTGKAILITTLVIAAFLFTPWPREVVALAGAGALLVSRRMASRDMLGLVDWHVLVLFIGLFVVNRAMADSGMAGRLLAMAAGAGVDVAEPATLFVVTAVLSNLVSNVPAVMLLLPVANDAHAGAVLALASTLAGNLIIVGSIANIIVVERAASLGVVIDWRTHARVGIPVTVLTLLAAAAWLTLIGA